MHCAVLLAIVALFLNVNALRVSASGRCGIQSLNLLTCKNSVFGSCCSKSGSCGSSSAFCGTGCQPRFGDCVSSTSSARATSSSKVTTVQVSSTLSVPSDPAIVSSTITTTAATLTSTTLSSVAPASTATGTKVSSDGTCGGSNAFTCSGSVFGRCCSEHGWCGNADIYCGTGCNAGFGSCGAASSSTSIPSNTGTQTSSTAPPSTQTVSTNGQCGLNSGGMTCLGSQFGDCCSEYSWCGSTTAFCETGCQNGFGKCNSGAVPSSPTVSTSPSSTSAAPGPTLTCGVEGFADSTDYYASSFNLIDTSDVSTCATLCLGEPTCMSYLFNPLLQNCAYLLYSLEQGEFIAEDGTDQLFWERACAQS